MLSIHRLVTLSVVVTVMLLTGCGMDSATDPTSDPSQKGGNLSQKGGNGGGRGGEPDGGSARDDDVPVYPGKEGFVAEIDNKYLAFEPGKVFEYAGETEDGFETIRVEVTHQKKTILEVSTTVVRDRVYLDGILVEDTFDWFAQDVNGNVWYFGEDSKTLDENGNVVSTEGSWKAGVDGEPGVIMLAKPEIGIRYQQERAVDIAEDMAKVVGLSASVTVQYGSFTGCLETLEWTPLEPGAREYKYYAPGVGLVLETSASGGKEPIELISITGP
jgi:hypothetical protein